MKKVEWYEHQAFTDFLETKTLQIIKFRSITNLIRLLTKASQLQLNFKKPTDKNIIHKSICNYGENKGELQIISSKYYDKYKRLSKRYTFQHTFSLLGMFCDQKIFHHTF